MKGLVEYSNSISIETESSDNLVPEALHVFEKRVKEFRPKTIKKTTDKIFYTGGVMRFVLNVNLLYCISEGEIRVESSQQTLFVHYVIKFYELVALSVIPAVGALVVMDSILEKVIGVLLVVFVSYGANALITILRYRRFVRKTLEDWLSERKPISISKDQKEWIDDSSKCDACGCIISDKDVECPDCGLRLR
jgi:hypothetical protein